MKLRITAIVAVTIGSSLWSCSKPSPDGPNPIGKNLVIEGTITDLQGSGLVLQNNGGSDQTVPPAAPGFVFVGISENSSYNISVRTQPTVPSQACTVTNGAGTIKFEPIRNVAIVCTTLSFAVRGGISGLTGSGLTFLLNGRGALTVPAGSVNFAFPPIPSATRYDVTISAQPAAQTCSINGGSGTVGAADVTTIAVSCGVVGLIIGGTVVGLGPNTGLTLRLNGGAPLPIAAQAQSFAFPNVLQTGTDYSVTVASPALGPLRTCLLARAKGRVGATNVTDMMVWCHANGLLNSYTGTYALMLNGRRNYLTLWFDGTYSLASRIDDPTCTNNGNGVEYGVYKRATSGATFIQIAIDNNGACGLWFGGSTPGVGGGFEGDMVRNGNTLTLTPKNESALTATAVESVPTSLVGAFTRADGQDGSFVVFESDGTYLYQETQQSGGSRPLPFGVERGCYTVSGATFTTSLAATCRPNTFPALDQNGAGGFSGSNGAAISFSIVSATSVTIGGVLYNRIEPAG